TIGFPRQLSGVQRSGMIQLLACRNGLPCRAGRFIHERIARENALKAHKHEENRFRESVVRMERPPKADAQSGARMPVPDFAMARRRRGERVFVRSIRATMNAHWHRCRWNSPFPAVS